MLQRAIANRWWTSGATRCLRCASSTSRASSSVDASSAATPVTTAAPATATATAFSGTHDQVDEKDAWPRFFEPLINSSPFPAARPLGAVVAPQHVKGGVLATDAATYPSIATMTRFEAHYWNVVRDDMLAFHPRTAEQELAAAERHLEEALANLPHDTSRLKVDDVRLAHSLGRAATIEKISLSSYVKEAFRDRQQVLLPLMILELISGCKATVLRSQFNNSATGTRKGQPIGGTVELRGDMMWLFLEKLVDIVLPRLKVYGGGVGFSRVGDQMGNFSMHLTDDRVLIFPELEASLDKFPRGVICKVGVHTTAITNEEGRRLIAGFRVPFFEPIKKKKAEVPAYMRFKKQQ